MRLALGSYSAPPDPIAVIRGMGWREGFGIGARGGNGRTVEEVDGWIRYVDTIRYAILTCARKPTLASLIYRTETTTKKCKTEKLKK